MGKKAVIKNNKIKCINGPVADMNIIVKNKQGVEWYSKLTKEQFTEHCKDNYSVQVFDQAGQPVKKYVKSFLTFVSEFETVLKNKKEPPQKTLIDSIMMSEIIPEIEEQAIALAEEAGQIVAVNSEGLPVVEEDAEDSEAFKEDALRIVDNLNEKEINGQI